MAKRCKGEKIDKTVGKCGRWFWGILDDFGVASVILVIHGPSVACGSQEKHGTSDKDENNKTTRTRLQVDATGDKRDSMDSYRIGRGPW